MPGCAVARVTVRRAISMRFLAAGLLLLAASAVADARPVRSLLEIRQADMVMQQWDNSCGAAALATVLTYHLHHPVTETEVAKGMLQRTEPLRVRYRGGFSLLDMKRYLAAIGFIGTGYSGLDWSDLARYTPAIVPIEVRGYHHFVVVRGIDGGEARIGDPGFGNYRLSRAEMRDFWTSGIAFVVTREGAGADETRSSGARDRAAHAADGGARADNRGGASTTAP